MESSVEESKDLKEHMVGILFSQSKLTHLQKQVRVRNSNVYRRFWFFEFTSIFRKCFPTGGVFFFFLFKKYLSIFNKRTAHLLPTNRRSNPPLCYELNKKYISENPATYTKSYFSRQNDRVVIGNVHITYDFILTVFFFFFCRRQVCTHIVDAIRKEAVAMREEWEKSVCKKNSDCNGTVTPTDSYCFEMLSMVSALSGSNVGRSYLADQHDLLSNLLSLLHTGSARVQRQVRAFFVSTMNFCC